MSAFIHIEFLDDISHVYHFPVLEWVSNNLSHVHTLDLDNFSDEVLFDYAQKIITQNDKAVVYIKVNEGAETKRLSRILNTLIKHKEKIFVVVLHDQDSFVNKLSGVLGDRCVENPSGEEVQTLLEEHLTW